MSKPLDMTERQVRAIIRAAKKEGYAPVVQIGNARMTLIPEDHAIHPQDDRTIDLGKDIRL